MLAFALSFDDLIITTFNAGVGSSTLPLYIYSRIRFGVTPEINAISTIIVAVTAVAILLFWQLGRARDQARVEDDATDAADATDGHRDRRRASGSLRLRPGRGARRGRRRRRARQPDAGDVALEHRRRRRPSPAARRSAARTVRWS